MNTYPMQCLLLGGHADGRRIEITSLRHLADSFWVPRLADVGKQHAPVVRDETYRRFTYKPDCFIFVHQTIPDDGVIDYLIAHHPPELDRVAPR